MADLTAVEKNHLASASAKLSSAEKAVVQKSVLQSQKLRKEVSIYSTVRFQFAISGTGPWTYSIAAGTKLTAFGYGFGDSANQLANAGFLAAFGNASATETSLLPGGSLGGKKVQINGMCLGIGSMSDAELVRRVWANVYADVSLNGSDRFMLLGPLSRIPCGGGLDGSAGRSYVLEPPATAPYATVGSFNNGQPNVNNYLRLPEPIMWNPAGQQDSNFAVRFQTDRQISYTTTLAADRAEAAGVVAWTHPDPAARGGEGTYVDVGCYLKAVEIIDRSTQY